MEFYYGLKYLFFLRKTTKAISFFYVVLYELMMLSFNEKFNGLHKHQ